MADLVAEFYSRDLSTAEAAELELIFENSADEAERFAELGLAEYKSMGLPEPRWKSGRGGAWKWPLVLLFAAGGAWAFMPAPKQGRPDLSLEGEAFSMEHAPTRAIQTLPVIRALEPISPRTKLTRKVPDETKRGRRLGVLVKQAVSGPARVTVKDSQGRELLELFNGTLHKGERRFEWDGRLADGSAANAGDYSIAVQRGKSLQIKQLSLKKP